MSRSFDVAVVGGGIVGLATAYRLLEKRPGLRLVSPAWTLSRP